MKRSKLWPGLSRPSTSLGDREQQDVDARNKCGHDAFSLPVMLREAEHPVFIAAMAIIGSSACPDDDERVGYNHRHGRA
jgi:hypothetical protein